MATKTTAAYHGAGGYEARIDARNPYPTDESLGEWLKELRALHGRGVRLIPDWGALVGSKLEAKVAEARAEAEAAGKCPDKAAMQVRKSPVRSAWQKTAPDWPECEEHLLRGGWHSWAPEEHDAIELDIDSGDVDAVAERLRGMFHVAGETVSVSGKRRLIVRHACPVGENGRRRRPKKTWTLPEGAGECLAMKATVCDPKALLAALDALPEVEEADLDALKAGGPSKQADMAFDAQADESQLEAAIEDAAERIEDAPEAEGNNTVAAQAWRAGKAAGTAEGIDVEAARERVVGAAVERQPHEAERAAATAGRQFDAGVESAETEPFEVRGGGRRTAEGAGEPAPDPILEDEVVTEEDAAALNRWWRSRAPVVPFEEPDMEGGRPIPDPHGLDEIRNGELGYINDREASIWLATEGRLADWIVCRNKAGPPDVWEYCAGAGWRPLEWSVASVQLGDELHGKMYTMEHKFVDTGLRDGKNKPIYDLVIKPKPTPKESSSSGFRTTVARTMAGWTPWFTRCEWHDANPWLLAHPDGTVTDIRTLGRRPQQRKDLLMKRTAVAPAEWRGSWVEEMLQENVPGEADRLLLQCVLGLGCIGVALCEAMLWLVGPASSGKTMLLEAAQAALGDDYTYVMDVKRLLKGRGADGFSAESSRSMLHRARLAILSGEPSPDDSLNEGAYKSLTGGGSGEGRRIGQDSTALHGSPYTLAATANRLPFAANDDATDRRTYVVACPRGRTEEERDAATKRRMLADEALGAFLGFMLEGGHMVAIRGRMPPRTAQQRARAQFPEKGEDEGPRGGGDPRNAARDARSGNMAYRVVEDFRPLLRAAVEAANGAPVWLDEEAEGADTALLDALDGVLRKYELKPGCKNRAEYARKAGFRTERRRPGNGDRAVRSCVVGPAK